MDKKEKLKEIINDNLFGRDKYIFEEVLYKERTYVSLSEELEVSPQRIGQLYRKAKKKVVDAFKFQKDRCLLIFTG